ncbi:MAG: tyrosine-type recombinase/integrase [Fimbriimonadaceae bacterium]|nr:tyrosine-type recombinase/integrase [Fimbriimonadaceae bacterium]
MAASRRDYGSGTVSFDPKRNRWVGRVWVRPTIGKARRLQVSAKTQRECERRVKELRLRAAEEVNRRSSPILADWLEEWLERKQADLSPKTQGQYARSARFWTELIGTCRLSELAARLISDCLETCTASRSAQMHRAMLRASLNDAMAEDLLDANPAERARAPKHVAKPKTILAPEEVARLVELEPNRVYRALWAFLALQGARPFAEAVPLSWSELEASEGLLWFRGAKTESGRRRRPIDPRLIPLLEDARQPGSDLVFPSESGTRLEESNVRRAWRRAVKRAEASPVTLYSLRAFAASEMARAGTDRITAAGLLGHANPSVTARFYEVSREQDLADAMKRRTR